MSVFVYRSTIGDKHPSLRPGLRVILPGGKTEEARVSPAGRGGLLPGYQSQAEHAEEDYDPLGHFTE